jgi:hypothetical protein
MLHLYFTKRAEGVVASSLCTAWRPATCTVNGKAVRTAPLSLKQPTGARIRIVLVLKASDKPLRPKDLARGRPFGTMVRNRAAPPNILWQSLDPLLFSRPVL